MTNESEGLNRETAQEILDYVHFAGFETTRSQLVRLHQEDLIARPETHYPGGRRGLETTYPAGTAQRVLRIAQLKVTTKKFDELAWRMWWEGHDVELSLVRTFLMKMASRWDDRRREIEQAASVFRGEEGTENERDVLNEVFYKSKAAPPIGTIRKRLKKDEDRFVEFASFVVDLITGNLNDTSTNEIQLFEDATGFTFAEDVDADGVNIAGQRALDVAKEALSKPFAEVARLLDDEQLENARSFSLLMKNMMTGLGEMMHDAYGGTGKGYGLIGKRLGSLTDQPEAQVIFLLMVSSFLKDQDVIEHLPEFETMAVKFCGVSYPDYQRLQYLAQAIPGIKKLMTPSRMRTAFDSPEGAERWRMSFVKFRSTNAKDIDKAIAAKPDLFDLQPTTVDALT